MMRKAILLIFLTFGALNISLSDANWQPEAAWDLVRYIWGNENYLFAGSDEGLLGSSDTGSTWNFLKDWAYTPITVSGNKIYAGSDKGLFYSDTKGKHWTAMNNNAFPYIQTGETRSYTIPLLATSGKNIIAGFSGQGIFLSKDEGRNWKEIDEGIPRENNEFFLSIHSLLIHGDTLFALIGLVSEIYRSTNYGKLWALANSGITNNELSCLAASGNKIFAGSRNGIFVSDNNGNTWSSGNNGLRSRGSRYIFSIANSGGNVFAATGAGVFISSDKDVNWLAIDSGLTYMGYREDYTEPYKDTITVNSLVITRKYIFAGTYEGIFRSADNGNTWVKKY
jgi:photosystem II stability/assembly factor-like uncharacterized protein